MGVSLPAKYGALAGVDNHGYLWTSVVTCGIFSLLDGALPGGQKSKGTGTSPGAPLAPQVVSASILVGDALKYDGIQCKHRADRSACVTVPSPIANPHKCLCVCSSTVQGWQKLPAAG